MVFALIVLALVALLEAGLNAYLYRTLASLHRELMDRFMAKNYGEFSANRDASRRVPEDKPEPGPDLSVFQEDWESEK